MQPTDWINLIGPEAALRLAEVCGGNREHIPDLERMHAAVVRNAGIMRELDAGHEYKTVALRYRLTVKQIRNIQKQFREARVKFSAAQ